jgi:hypothetical protein
MRKQRLSRMEGNADDKGMEGKGLLETARATPGLDG